MMSTLLSTPPTTISLEIGREATPHTCQSVYEETRHRRDNTTNTGEQSHNRKHTTVSLAFVRHPSLNVATTHRRTDSWTESDGAAREVATSPTSQLALGERCHGHVDWSLVLRTARDWLPPPPADRVDWSCTGLAGASGAYAGSVRTPTPLNRAKPHAHLLLSLVSLFLPFYIKPRPAKFSPNMRDVLPNTYGVAGQPSPTVTTVDNSAQIV
ncbi:hypothetical protein EAI_04155 [Harpegnathos saltator]|uniref:Uncharacterized protein n=1 Tax=Harpegnathos saltator TaxID=610380 RepID=E2BVS9_HARSA|nr:hypothetical protein EAI_04155 [Harpegnathos saltator]